MNEATYVYIVHSDINENNIYAEFATEEEAIDYARRHKDELTYVDKAEVALDEDGEIIEIFDSETVWVYDEEDEFESEEEFNEFNIDFDTDLETLNETSTILSNETYSKVLYYVYSNTDEEWYETFEIRDEAIKYAEANSDYDPFIVEVTVNINQADEVEDWEDDPRVIWGVDRTNNFKQVNFSLDAVEDSEDEPSLSEAVRLRTREEQDEFFRLCNEIGLITIKDIENFKKEVGCTDENLLQALRDYRAELGPDFEIKEDIDFDKLVEELEEHEDIIECKECYNLVAKESCHKNEAGKYVCEKCAGKLEENKLRGDSVKLVGDKFRPGKPINLVDLKLLMKGCDLTLRQHGEKQINLIVRFDNICAVVEETEKAYLVSVPCYFRDPKDRTKILDYPKYFAVWIPKTRCIPVEGAEKVLSETLTDNLSELTPAQLTEMETYLRTGKDLHLEDYEEEHADFAIDIVGGDLTYNEKTNTFDFYLSIYHASEDNNAEYPEYHTDEEEYSFDSLEEVYDEFPQYLIDIYKFSHHEFSKIEETLTEETIESEQELEGTDNAVVDCKVADVVAHCEDEKPVDCEGEEKPLEKPLAEETHAQFAKPEGNRVQAYNNALKYAKQYNTDFIYGYTNHAGKFFALEQPIKATDLVEAEKEFKNKYKNCKVIYVAYPDKAFLRETLYSFTPEEQAEYGIDEEGYSLDGFDTYVRCNWCGEVYPEFNCEFEANLGWLCPRCQDEVRSHGGPLTIVEDPSEEQIQATLEEAFPMTRDELMDKEGTDDVELINAGRPEEERVELVEE